MSVALAIPLHDPRGDLLKVASERLPKITGFYHELYAVATDKTDWHLIDLLESLGFHVEVQVDGEGIEHISEARRMVIKGALSGECSHIHFVDFDRILLWATLHLEELESIVGLIPFHDFLILGRTSRALQTHPRSQLTTEEIANTVTSILLGIEVDVTGASRGLSRRATELILKHSKAGYCNTDSEWPLIIKHKSDVTVTWLNVQGLEYEDWLKLPEEQKTIEGVEEHKMRIDKSPRSWVHRMKTALYIAKTAIEVNRELNSE